MKLHVLGCSGAIAAGCKTTSFLIDSDILVDAGTGIGDLPLEALSAVDHILLSHSHLDHVLGIPLMADSVMRCRLARTTDPIRVYALAETLQALRVHLFNNVLWPDFTRLPSPDRPILELVEIRVGQVLTLGGRTIEVLPAAHTVPAVGYAVETGSGWWVYTGDTGPNPALWTLLQDRRIAQLVIETAFGDEERALARISRHLCPATLFAELAQRIEPTPVAITHIKPGETAAVMAQIAGLPLIHPITALRSGQIFTF
jgi:ribonuclease BN (tRNA processing enzyme)